MDGVGKFQQERKRSFLTYELESGSGVTVDISDNTGAIPSKLAERKRLGWLFVGVIAATEQKPPLLY